jgi:hypothetical protein
VADRLEREIDDHEHQRDRAGGRRRAAHRPQPAETLARRAEGEGRQRDGGEAKSGQGQEALRVAKVLRPFELGLAEVGCRLDGGRLDEPVSRADEERCRRRGNHRRDGRNRQAVPDLPHGYRD